jgi:light-regulated signal transduction histidine kinase (bacteriophytochrome)
LPARTNADLEQFAYSASHDLQEPLRMIANYSQLPIRGYRGRLDEGTQRMQGLLADLLAYTRLSADGRGSAEIVDLGAVYEKVIQNLRAAIEESGAFVTCDLLPRVPGAAEEMDGHWRLAVTDNGIGISPEYHRKIFGVFKRLHGKAIPVRVSGSRVEGQPSTSPFRAIDVTVFSANRVSRKVIQCWPRSG